MNKKAFSLVEMLVVIGLIAVLTIMITPAIIVVRNNILENTLESKIININNAAKDFAAKHIMDIPSPVSKEYDEDGENSINDCLPIQVKALINNGYLLGDSDDRREIINPLTEESMNNYTICIRYNNNDAMNREIVTYIIGEDSLYEN